MMKQIELVLSQFLVADTKTAQWPKTGVDAVDRARLCCERLDQFAAAANEGTRLGGQFAGRLQRSDLPNFLEGERVPVQLNHSDYRRGDFLENTLSAGKRGVKRKVKGSKTHGAIGASSYALV